MYPAAHARARASVRPSRGPAYMCPGSRRRQERRKGKSGAPDMPDRTQHGIAVNCLVGRQRMRIFPWPIALVRPWRDGKAGKMRRLRFRRRGEAEGSHRSLGEAGSPTADGGYTISAWRGRAGEKGVPFGGIRARFICKEKEKKVSSDRDGRDQISIPSQSHHPIIPFPAPGPRDHTTQRLGLHHHTRHHSFAVVTNS